ncbi:MAG: hypothetical protein P8J30_00580 [Ilumatobacter sp.]|nr:hypothetical protein [Ilumatobacter sp.]
MDLELSFERRKLPVTIGPVGFCRLRVPESFPKDLACVGAQRHTFGLLRRNETVGCCHPHNGCHRLLVDFVLASDCTQSAWCWVRQPVVGRRRSYSSGLLADFALS